MIYIQNRTLSLKIECIEMKMLAFISRSCAQMIKWTMVTVKYKKERSSVMNN